MNDDILISIPSVSTCKDNDSDMEYSESSLSQNCYSEISNIYTDSYESDNNNEYNDKCCQQPGTTKHAVITLLVGFLFPFVWCTGCISCCCREDYNIKEKAYIIYSVQLFLLLSACSFGFVLFWTSDFVQNVFLFQLETNEYNFTGVKKY